MTEIRHTFLDRPTTLLATVSKEALAARRVEDTLVSARTVLIAPAPTIIESPVRPPSFAPPPQRTTPWSGPPGTVLDPTQFGQPTSAPLALPAPLSTTWLQLLLTRRSRMALTTAGR
jgi:hypothetical protein